MKRTIVALLLAGFALSAAFASGSEETADSDGPVQLNWLAGGWSNQLDPEGYFADAVLEALNIDLTVELMPNGQLMNEKRQVLVAGGDYPEILMGRTDALYKQWSQQGVFVQLDPYWNDYPGLVAGLPEDATLQACRVDGKLYMVPIVLASNRVGLAYRQDWLDELGLDVPNTLDEFNEVLEAFANEDPDGDGARNTYGYGMDKFTGGGSTVIMSAFGIPGGPTEWHEQPDGTLLPNFLHENFKDALALLKDHYESGIIDPDSVTKIYNELQSDFFDGRTGTFINQNTSIVVNELNIQEIDPDGKIVHGPPIINPDGGRIWRFFSATWRGNNITNKASEAQIDAALRLFEWMMTDGEELTFFGPEGVYWTERNSLGYPIIEGEGLDAYGSSGDGFSMFSLMMRRLAPETLLTVEVLRDPAAVERVSEAFAVYEPYGVVDPMTGITTPTMTELGATLTDIMQAGIFNVVIAEQPVSSIDAVIADWRQKGGDLLIQEVNEAYASN